MALSDWPSAGAKAGLQAIFTGTNTEATALPHRCRHRVLDSDGPFTGRFLFHGKALD